MDSLSRRLEEVLTSRRAQDLYRQRIELHSPQGPQVVVDGRKLCCFCSNDYLGLANHPAVITAFHAGADQYGVGSGASHLVVGHTRVHAELEERLAALTGRSRALLFSTGYGANLGVLTALLGKGDSVFEDRLNHASLLDGGLFSGARFRRFLHNDPHSLESHLKKTTTDGLKLVAVDGVFSMDGDSAPLAELAAVANCYDASLMVDDAHGFGVTGKSGAGSVEAAGLTQEDVPILMATLGKAMGTAGAFVAGSDDLIDTLVQLSRTYIYSTALPPALAAATLKSIELLEKESWRRAHLQALIVKFREGIRELGLDLMPSDTAIQPIVLGSAEESLRWSMKLADRGLLVTAIRPPTVAEGTSRLRITLTAAHTDSDIDALLRGLRELA